MSKDWKERWGEDSESHCKHKHYPKPFVIRVEVTDQPNNYLISHTSSTNCLKLTNEIIKLLKTKALLGITSNIKIKAIAYNRHQLPESKLYFIGNISSTITARARYLGKGVWSINLTIDDDGDLF